MRSRTAVLLRLLLLGHASFSPRLFRLPVPADDETVVVGGDEG